MLATWRGPISIFLLVFLIHTLSPVALSGDSRWSVLVAESLLDRHDSNLDEYLDRIKASGYYGVECVTSNEVVGAAMGDCTAGHIYHWYPIGTPLLAAPLVWIIRASLYLLSPILTRLPVEHAHPVIRAFFLGDLTEAAALVEVIVASVFVALAAMVLFLTARRFLQPRYAAAISLIFAFATPAWSIASRALWQHGPSTLMLSLAIWLLVLAEDNPRMAQFAALPVTYAYLIRPTNALIVVVATAYVLVRHREVFLRYLLWALPVAVGFASYNLSAFGRLLPSYYALRPPPPDSSAAIIAVLRVMAGNLISPSRGLLIFTPILIFSVVGMAKALRTGWMRPLPAFLIALVLLHWLSISLFVPFWWGGYSYGPRLFSDMIPVFVLFLIPVFMDWPSLTRSSRIIFAVLLAISFLIHARGGLTIQPHYWNANPVSVDQHPERVWDWKDPQMLRGLH